MLDNELTRDDRNYWDAMHFNRATALRLAQLVAAADRAELNETDPIKVLYRSTDGHNDNYREVVFPVERRNGRRCWCCR